MEKASKIYSEHINNFKVAIIMNNLTDREFWRNYWNNYHYKKIKSTLFFDKYLDDKILCQNDCEFIEIGGFPGEMSIYFRKKYNCKVTLLDFYIDKTIINNLETENGLPINTIKFIESDFFQFNATKYYNFVFSYGFIEHFEDTKDVIERHINLAKKGGEIFIILPNFRGINGWFQYLFDRNNYNIHNINSMKICVLNDIMNSIDLKDYIITYVGKPMIWLAPKNTLTNKIFRPFVKLLSYFIKLFPIRSRLLSPYIIIKATK